MYITKTSKDFNALRRKLIAGKTLAVAAEESGMTIEEAKSHLADRTNQDDDSLRSMADEMIAVAFRAMKKFLKEGNRSVQETCEMGSSKEAVLDLPAAKALLEAGMEARKMLRHKEKSTQIMVTNNQSDLFDSSDSPWNFKKSD